MAPRTRWCPTTPTRSACADARAEWCSRPTRPSPSGARATAARAAAAAKVERIDGADDGMHVQKSTSSECSGARVVFYRIVGRGHNWPSCSHYLPGFAIGEVNRDFPAAAEMWRFFEGVD